MSLPAGSIDYLELKVCLRALGFNLTGEELRRIVQVHDRMHTGRIAKESFLDIGESLYLARAPEDVLSQTFALFDEEQKGFITRGDVRRVFAEVGEKIDEETVRLMIDEYGSGDRVSMEDFKAVLADTTFL